MDGLFIHSIDLENGNSNFAYKIFTYLHIIQIVRLTYEQRGDLPEGLDWSKAGVLAQA